MSEQRNLDDRRPVPFAADLSGPCRPDRLGLTLADGYQTSVYAHRARGPTKRLPVVYLHGIQSHPGWFVQSASFLAGRGHDVFQPTRRGSGDNAASRGHAQSAGLLLDDLHAACRLALDQSAAGRLHLLAVSWGGKLAIAYAADIARQAQLASLTLVAPGIAPRVDVSLWTKLAVAGAILACPRRQFAIPLSDVELFTDNEAMRQYLRQDHCRLLRATARFLYVSSRLDRMLRSLPPACLGLPTTLILAGHDRIIDSDRTRQAVERLTGGKADVRVFDAAHTLEFESRPQPFLDSLADALADAELV